MSTLNDSHVILSPDEFYKFKAFKVNDWDCLSHFSGVHRSHELGQGERILKRLCSPRAETS